MFIWKRRMKTLTFNNTETKLENQNVDNTRCSVNSSIWHEFIWFMKLTELIFNIRIPKLISKC